MNKKIYEHLRQYCEKDGYEFEESDTLEILQNEEELHRETVDCKRHWDEIFKVAKVDGMFIGYYDAETTGDLTAHECGWDFNPKSCCEVERHEEIKIVVSWKLIK